MIFESKAPFTKTKSKYEDDNRTNDDDSNNSFLMDKLIVHDVQKNEEMLKKRREELEKGKLVSGQIKDIAHEMKLEVMVQGENLNVISNHVMEINENASKAEKEIKKANEVSKSSRKKTAWIIGIIVVVVAATITIVLLVTSPWDKKE